VWHRRGPFVEAENCTALGTHFWSPEIQICGFWGKAVRSHSAFMFLFLARLTWRSGHVDEVVGAADDFYFGQVLPARVAEIGLADLTGLSGCVCLAQPQLVSGWYRLVLAPA
jgi:hypothetical protein